MLTPLFDPSLAEKVSAAGIVAVLVIDEAGDAVPLARALLEGGVGVMELTLRTPAALDALRHIRREVPEMVAGIGTILSVEQLHAAREAGAAFGVSPGCNPRLLAAAREAGFSFGPGIASPTDVEIAIEHGCRLLKFFPAEQLGGLAYLRAMSAPYAHLGLRYIPLGGLTAKNAGEYLQDPLIAAIGGSWIAPREAVKAHDWAAITANAQGASRSAEARKG
ncbi:MAG: bifunctional 4-hydroxy-2-oxoglutarate aldolase/2-dehydro-3-deoxy-phosphogluconate aldolase [Chthoniobacterales bacterium]|jgi:2-dehydro-3-deoxyphosphogluconate aldolase / (4S)-4-hydroxy-2-oxoglutarate aldolase|nr:bifunctional 4-hydroxy-2-oxoglutarate aldolase/2-dehydro-3-deoxy-phosphogluconate aldolase [Chthoniobacterales bacterium]